LLELVHREQRNPHERSVAGHGPRTRRVLEEDPCEGIVIFGRDRIELVSWQTGAREWMPRKAFETTLDLVVQ